MIRYVSAFKTNQSDQGDRLATLIWVDPGRILDVQGDLDHVKARRQEGWYHYGDLNDTSLFEIRRHRRGPGRRRAVQDT